MTCAQKRPKHERTCLHEMGDEDLQTVPGNRDCEACTQRKDIVATRENHHRDVNECLKEMKKPKLRDNESRYPQCCNEKRASNCDPRLGRRGPGRGIRVQKSRTHLASYAGRVDREWKPPATPLAVSFQRLITECRRKRLRYVGCHCRRSCASGRPLHSRIPNRDAVLTIGHLNRTERVGNKLQARQGSHPSRFALVKVHPVTFVGGWRSLQRQFESRHPHREPEELRVQRHCRESSQNRHASWLPYHERPHARERPLAYLGTFL